MPFRRRRAAGEASRRPPRAVGPRRVATLFVVVIAERNPVESWATAYQQLLNGGLFLTERLVGSSGASH
jgi:hypothetical protein